MFQGVFHICFWFYEFPINYFIISDKSYLVNPNVEISSWSRLFTNYRIYDIINK